MSWCMFPIPTTMDIALRTTKTFDFVFSRNKPIMKWFLRTYLGLGDPGGSFARASGSSQASNGIPEMLH